jgi:predicted nucleotidyltransferase
VHEGRSSIPEKLRDDLDKAISVLREHGARAVYIFGSMTDRRGEGEPHDIDLAVSGLAPRQFLHAYGILLGELDHPFDLIDLDSNNRFSRRLVEHGNLERVA